MFLRIKNRKQFLVVKLVFIVFCFKEHKTILKETCLLRFLYMGFCIHIKKNLNI